MTTPEIAGALRVPARTVRYHLAQLTRQKLLEAPVRTAGRRYSLPLSSESVPSGMASAGPVIVPGSAELVGDDPAVLTRLDFAPALQNQVMSSPNGRAYASVVVVGASTRSPLGDRELDAFETFATAVAPTAEPVRATTEVGWWRIADAPRMDQFQIWLYPGPLVQVHWALDASDAPDDGNIALDPIGLVVYWRHVLRNASQLAQELDFGQCVVGLNIQTLPSSRPYVVDMDFGELPRPTRSGAVESVPLGWRRGCRWMRRALLTMRCSVRLWTSCSAATRIATPMPPSVQRSTLPRLHGIRRRYLRNSWGDEGRWRDPDSYDERAHLRGLEVSPHSEFFWATARCRRDLQTGSG